VEINQVKSVPQTASTGSAGASVAAATGGEAGSDGFLSLINCFMNQGVPEDNEMPDATPAAGQETQAASAIPDGMLSLIAPGLFSSLVIQPRQPASGDAAGAEAGMDLAAAAPAGEAAPTPLNAPPPAPLQAPVGPRPDLPPKGLAPQPGEGEPAADGDEMPPDAEAQISEEDLAKLVAEGKAKVEARQDVKARQPAAETDQSKAPVTPERITPRQAAPRQTPPEQAASRQATPEQATPEQATATVKIIPAPVIATVQIAREPAPVEVKPTPRPDAGERLTAESADPGAQAVPATDADADKALAADDAPGDGKAWTGSDDTGQEGGQEDGTHGSRQAQQHSARIDRANERNAEQQAGDKTSRSSAPSAGIEAESRGGAAVQTASGAADDGGKPVAAKERGLEAGPTFEDTLAKVKPAHREPEADNSLGVQAATQGVTETEAAERTAAPHSRGAVPHSAADQVSVQLGKAVPGKNDQMVINLKPVELGSVEVRLDFGADGKVQASIMAEQPETLEMLQKDQRMLERALNDAGLQTDPGSLSFNLKGQGQGGNQRQFAGYNQPGSGRGKGFARMDIEGPAIPDFAAPQYSASGTNRTRLDIRI
jgi:flagellar hook-length control protein FliK